MARNTHGHRVIVSLGALHSIFNIQFDWSSVSGDHDLHAMPLARYCPVLIAHIERRPHRALPSRQLHRYR